MVRALYLEFCPNMDSVSAVDILDEFDPLYGNLGKSDLSSGKYKVIKSSFYTDNYNIDVFDIDNQELFKAIYRVYDLIQRSASQFVKVLICNNSIYVVIPRYPGNIKENKAYSDLIDELVRVSTFFARRFDDLTCCVFLKDYISTFVSYPGNRGIQFKEVK